MDSEEMAVSYEQPYGPSAVEARCTSSVRRRAPSALTLACWLLSQRQREPPEQRPRKRLQAKAAKIEHVNLLDSSGEEDAPRDGGGGGDDDKPIVAQVEQARRGARRSAPKPQTLGSKLRSLTGAAAGRAPSVAVRSGARVEPSPARAQPCFRSQRRWTRWRCAAWTLRRWKKANF
jgi:hypothetical protein